MNAVHVRNQKHELTPPRNRDKPVTQQDALPNSEVPAKIIRPGRTCCLPAEASPLSSCQGRLLKQCITKPTQLQSTSTLRRNLIQPFISIRFLYPLVQSL
ncbi:hypothetical protein V6N12_065747 [Hibiscus sabdariffa]|uniref:Uncharacterized protein n=1 Tax=Hibiscus sabdariffa TaxID=183260 RepID=A0ABR2GAL8_9ROSI